jgi:PAS domain S-box-containing protein
MRKQELLLELETLRQKLEEAEDTIRAIRAGEVDAVVVSGPTGEQVFVLKGAEEAYRIFLETMSEGAVALMADGTIAYSNQRFSEMLKTPLEQVMGAPIAEFVAPEHRHRLQPLLAEVLAGNVHEEIPFLTRDGTAVWTKLSLSRIKLDDATQFCLVATDITERKKAEALRAYLAAIVDSSDDAIFGKDLDGTIRTWNPGAEGLFGYSAGEIIGHSSSILHSPDHSDDYFDILKRIGLGEAIKHYETERVRKDGQSIYVSLTVTALRDAHGHIEGASTIARDITERKLAEQEVLRLNQDLERRVAERTIQLEHIATELETRNLEVERMNRMKTDFLSRMSHELRTPLHAIVGYSDLLGEQSAGPLPAPYPRFVANIQEGARHLLAMVNDLLDISRIEAGRIDLNREVFRAADVLEEVLSVIAPLATIKRIAIENAIPGGMTIRADRTRFKQVLYNLVSNAVKFTPENGRVWITEASREDAAGFCVGDTGIGIPESELELVFDEFHQAGAAGTAKEGSGLGLAITRRLVGLHGGTIGVESTVGEGSRFTFWLGANSLEPPNVA